MTPLGVEPCAMKAGALGTVFHEKWWLNAVTSGGYDEAVVKNGNDVVGRLPFVVVKKLGITTLRMPPLTHVLGPIVDAGAGKPQTQMLRRLSIVRGLVDKLPRFDYFQQALNSSIVDGLAFQDRGFQVRIQYTFEIDCRDDPMKVWDAMHFKTRQHIRRAEERFSVSATEDPHAFIRFYRQNSKVHRGPYPAGSEVFPAAFAACRARDSGTILSATWPSGRPAAMIFLIWGQGTMYYLLSSRAGDDGDNGSINLLIWSAIKEAHKRDLIFDLDGVATSGMARFLSGFGGRMQIRTIVERSNFAYRALRLAKRQLRGVRVDETQFFT